MRLHDNIFLRIDSKKIVGGIEIIYLENEQCSVGISLHGAELKSFKNSLTGFEYIWKSDPVIWNRSAPFLFPIVGRLKSNAYFYQNKKFSLGQHGFLRDMDFKVKKQTENQVTLFFKSSPETFKLYPFHFEILIHYGLENNTLSVGFTLNNISEQSIPFSYGNHAGFSTPINPELNFEDYYLEATPNKDRERIVLTDSKQADLGNSFMENNFPIRLTHNLFKQDALIYKTEGQTQFTLKSDKDPAKLVVSFKDFDYVGIWSPYPTLGNFVCIQPWCGIADRVGTDQQLENKYGIYQLEKKESFSREFMISIY